MDHKSYDAIEEVLPKHGLLHDYCRYTSGNEICTRFRAFSFIAALGGLVRRKVYFQRSSYDLFPTVFPNLWIILVAPQGRGHKTTALSIVKKMLNRLPEHHQPRFMAAKLTPEALVKTLAVQSLSAEVIKNLDPIHISILKKPAQAILYASELGVLFGKEKYNQGMIPLLTDLYDTPEDWNSETIMRGDQRLYDVCLSIMGASTPDWMQSMLPPDAFKGGFMSRMLIIGYPETWDKRVSDPPPANAKLGTHILEQLVRIDKIEGEMKWEPAAKAYFDDWYNQLKVPDPGPRSAYLERKQDHLIKLAIILQLCEESELLLKHKNIECAMSMLNAVEKDTLRMIDYISVEPRLRFVQRVLELAEAREAITESELLAETWRYMGRPQDFNDAITMLIKAKKLAIKINENNEVVYVYNKAS